MIVKGQIMKICQDFFLFVIFSNCIALTWRILCVLIVDVDESYEHLELILIGNFLVWDPNI